MNHGKSFEELWEDLQQVLVQHLRLQYASRSKHAAIQMAERKIDHTDIQYVVKNNLPDEMYKPYEYPYGEHPFSNLDPVFSITGQDKRGRWITVVVVVRIRRDRLHFGIITAIAPVSPKSRHRNAECPVPVALSW
ncbi:DUF4258 domain-containing protein [Alicyclobacillus tolerans]|uniref:DUF4258 domain-containing protein n=1 Tax=Alicyclobacillus tolerans TaxID=90970 RepID=UPI001F450345|nr:DUF4258 domain-containing protein [Alicyclobacillus tolerans]MCF8568430.1 DUF4258 domain-containing protein [Alicyclobacillus tolerans]